MQVRGGGPVGTESVAACQVEVCGRQAGMGSLKDKKQGFLILRLQKLGEEHSRKREHMCTGPKQGIWLLQGTYP